MKQSGKHRCLRIMTGIMGILLAVGAAVFLRGERAEAAEDSITTGKNGWAWEYWTSPDDENSHAYGKCVNQETGECLAGGWYVVDGCWYLFTKKGYTVDEYHSGYFLGNCRNGGAYEEENENPDKYFWEKNDRGWRYATRHEVEKDDGETEIVKDYLTSCSAWIDAHLYLFDEDGYLPNQGWYEDESGSWYWITSSGACTLGWQKIGKQWFFFDYASGKMAEAGGRDTSAPFMEEPDYYVISANGSLRLRKGWVQSAEGHWFYTEQDGRPVYGWQQIDGTDYYFEEKLRGQMAASMDVVWYQDGFYLNADGEKADDGYEWIEEDEIRIYKDEDDQLADVVAYIDGWMYTFDKDGCCKYGVDLFDGTRVTYRVKGYEYTYDDLYLLAAVIYCEAGAEPYEGQLAVGNVVMNRVHMDRYDDTLEEVVYAPYQFSVVNSSRFKKCLETGGSETALRAAKEALEGNNNNVEGCIGFRLASSVDPEDSKYIIIGHIAFF